MFRFLHGCTLWIVVYGNAALQLLMCLICVPSLILLCACVSQVKIREMYISVCWLLRTRFGASPEVARAERHRWSPSQGIRTPRSRGSRTGEPAAFRGSSLPRTSDSPHFRHPTSPCSRASRGPRDERALADTTADCSIFEVEIKIRDRVCKLPCSREPRPVSFQTSVRARPSSEPGYP